MLGSAPFRRPFVRASIDHFVQVMRGFFDVKVLVLARSAYPASINCLACSKACLLSFTAMIPLLKSALFPPVCGEHDALHARRFSRTPQQTVSDQVIAADPWGPGPTWTR